MKFGKFGTVGKVALILTFALAAATLFSACATLTVGFLYVATTSTTQGQIEVYEVNSETGGLRTIPTSPFPSGGRNPLAETVSPDYKNLYAANNEDNNIVQFGIGTDGKLYSQTTINTPGTFPLAMAVTTEGGSSSSSSTSTTGASYLYVLDQLEPLPGCSQSNPCPGAIAGYAIQPTSSSIYPGSLGVGPSGCSLTPSSGQSLCSSGNPVVNTIGSGTTATQSTYLTLQLSSSDSTVLTPTAIVTTPDGKYVYATAYNPTTSLGYLFTYAISATDGSLTVVPSGESYCFGSTTCSESAMIPQTPASLGSEPSGIAVDPASSYAYVVDKIGNTLTAFSIQSGGLLTKVSSAVTGAAPSSVTLSSTGYIYAANSIDGTVNGYSSSSGTLSTIGTYATSENPVAIIGDPRQLGFLYTVNFLGNSVSGFQVQPGTGVLVNTQNTPYGSIAQPTAITGIPHSGNTH